MLLKYKSLSLFKNELIKKLPYLLLIFVLYFLLYKLYIPRILEFGCFDDCHTIATGYFIAKGKEIYSEIFYNHQLIFPYLSSLIQTITQPDNVYELILRHRQVILLLSFLFNLIFIFRFGKIGFLFVILFEFSKFYFFGDRFLPEAIVVYPAVYMAFVALNKLNGVQPKIVDYLISSLYTFFIVFAREPYIPLSLFLFLLILLNKKDLREKVISVILFVCLSVIALLTVNLKEFIFIFFTFNPQAVIQAEIAQGNSGGFGILKLVFYPFFLLFSGENTFLRHYLIGISISLIVSGVLYLKQTRNFKLVLVSLLILGAACTRFVSPGQVFFEAYRLNVWYGILLITTLFYILNIKRVNIKAFILASLLILVSFGYLILNKESFILRKADPHFSLLTNYGRIHQIGEVVKILSKKDDSFFADGAEEILYPVSGLNSNYKYSLYASQMPMFEKYTKARLEMLENNPPDFYYDFCKDAKVPTYRLEEKYKTNYIQLIEEGKPSCLFINKNKLKQIKPTQIEKLKEWRFTL